MRKLKEVRKMRLVVDIIVRENCPVPIFRAMLPGIRKSALKVLRAAWKSAGFGVSKLTLVALK